jgi:hypothetical protein
MRLGIRPTAVALILAFLTACVVSLASATARAAEPESPAGEADFTLDWNGVLREAILSSNLGNPAAIRIGAIVHCAMFDAYNAVERRYESIHVTKDAPRGTSPHAAVIQAAYVTLSAFFPAQIATFDGQRSRSLALLAGNEQNTSIEQGLAWGAKVAQEVLAWRASDGFDQPRPSFVGGNAVGQWRSTTSPPSSMAAQSMGFTLPFVPSSATQFEFAPPRGLDTAQWLSDYGEVKRLGPKEHSERSAEQSAIAFFWNGYATVDWNEAAEQIARHVRTTRAQNARLFALLNIALADAAITTFSAKRRYGADPNFVTWRPETAIRLADQDANSAAQPDPGWTPLIATPNHPEYPASHPASHGAGAEVLRQVFGDNHSFTLHPQFASTLPTPPNLQPRSFTSLTAAEQEGNEARIYGGMHYRSSVDASAAVGHAVARYVLDHAARPRHGDRND